VSYGKDETPKNPKRRSYIGTLEDLNKENDTLTPYFLLLLFDTPTWHVLSRITMKEKTQLFWNTCVSGVECLSG